MFPVPPLLARFLLPIFLLATLFSQGSWTVPGSADVRILVPPGPEHADSRRVWQGIPSLTITPTGRLFIAWYSGGDKEGSVSNYVLLTRSVDGGRSWEAPLLAVKGNDGVRTGDPLPWCDPKGRLWLLWSELHPDKARRGTWAIRCDHPDSDELVWSAPRFLGPGICLGKGIVKRGTGEWLLPLDVRNDSPLAAPIGRNRAGVMVSEDEGERWGWRGGWTLRDEQHDFDEHGVVELDDGALFSILRLKGGLAKSRSSDAGRTWSTPESLWPQTRSRAHLSRLASGNLLLIHHDGPASASKTGTNYRREALTAFLSLDQGKTWTNKLLLDPRNGVSYPDAAQGVDGRIHVTYDHDRYVQGAKEVLHLSFTEADVVQGRKIDSPTLVNRATGFGNERENREGKKEEPTP